jgi:hypothetical protein
VLLVGGKWQRVSWREKEVFWVEGASHVDLHGRDKYVIPAVSKLADFFHANLAAAPDLGPPDGLPDPNSRLAAAKIRMFVNCLTAKLKQQWAASVQGSARLAGSFRTTP